MQTTRKRKTFFYCAKKSVCAVRCGALWVHYGCMQEGKGVLRECIALRRSGLEVAVNTCEFVVSVSDEVLQFREECGVALG